MQLSEPEMAPGMHDSHGVETAEMYAGRNHLRLHAACSGTHLPCAGGGVSRDWAGPAKYRGGARMQ